MATVTQQTSAQALRGQNVVVTLSNSDRDSVLKNLTVGQTCTITGNTGKISEIFAGGSTFLIAPNGLGARFDSSGTPGILAASTSITIN